MTFPMTLVVNGISIVIPVNDTQTVACRKMDLDYSDEEWIQFHIDKALGLMDYLDNPEHPDYIPF